VTKLPQPIDLNLGVCKKTRKTEETEPKNRKTEETEPKNRRNRTEKPVNRKKFPKKSVQLTEPEKNFGFWFDYGSDGSKIRLTEPKLEIF